MLVEKVVEAGDYRVRYQVHMATADNRTESEPRVDVVVVGEELHETGVVGLWRHRFESLPKPPVRTGSDALHFPYTPLALLAGGRVVVARSHELVAIDVKVGTLQWERSFGNTEIARIGAIEKGTKSLVLHSSYEFDQTLGANLFLVSADGQLDWRAALYHPSDTYLDFTVEPSGKLIATSWNGLACTINISTGEIAQHRQLY